VGPGSYNTIKTVNKQVTSSFAKNGLIN